MSKEIFHKTNSKDFWKNLPKPFFVLAPMAEVTDIVFREFVLRHSRPDVFFTEFVSCKGLLSEKGRKHLMRDLLYTEKQQPIVAQIFGGDPKDFTPVAKLLRNLGFDGIDINMGCPDKKVEKQGAGASLIQDPERARAIIRATKEGAGDIPVSVKTRIGYHKIQTQEWIEALCKEKPNAITLHARTRKEMSDVPAQWEEVRKAFEITSHYGIPLIGNGDVESREQGEILAKKTGANGVMIGRGVYGNPWVFERNPSPKSFEEKIEALAQLIFSFSSFWGEEKNYEILKRFFKSYIQEFPRSKEIRIRLMETKTSSEALGILGELMKEDKHFLERVYSYEKIILARDFRRKNGEYFVNEV
ncbi:MAG: tRNA-dihydrouridine synthase family protein [Candidatus Moranbacteria bacterium]|nr:tRNA-dihydrouridine synthase family protein [Candidatus Moranbacteria bacterium]